MGGPVHSAHDETLGKVWLRIGRLREKYPKATPHHQISIQADEAVAKAIELSWQRQPADNPIATHPEVYCLRSDLTDWDALRL